MNIQNDTIETFTQFFAIRVHRKNFTIYIDPGIPLGIPSNPRSTFNLRPEINSVQLDERIKSLVSIAAGD